MLQEFTESKPLTAARLAELPPCQEFVVKEATDQRLAPLPVKIVAVTGAVGDWAIYYHYHYHPTTFVKAHGDKVFTEQLIRDLVPCTQDALERYRR